MIGDIDTAAGEALVAELQKSTGSEHHHFQHCDVTNWQSQVSFFQTAVRLSPTGGIDAVVPNAGIGHDPAGFESPEGLDGESPPRPNFLLMDVNLTGVLYTVHLALFWLPRNSPEAENNAPNGTAEPAVVQRDRHILLIGSIAGLFPLVGSAQYTASKHAITGLFRSLRGSVYQQGIRVNLICPHFVDTNILGNQVMFILAGGGLGQISDVVDTASSFMADRTVVGRGVVIGPRMNVEDGEDGETKLVSIPGRRQRGTAVWDMYVHDYEHVEAYVYRWTRLLLGLAKFRGWFGWLKDVTWITFWRRPGRK